MNLVIEKDKRGNKLLRILLYAIYIVLIVGAIQFFFNKNHSDDHYGTISLLAFWVLRSLHEMLLSFWGGDKKYVAFHFLLAMVAWTFLIYVAFFNAKTEIAHSRDC